MKIRILDNAKFDLLDGFEFYERQQKGLGRYFLDCLFSEIDALVNTFGIHLETLDGFHRLLAKRFPYAVYYNIEEEFVIVYAVMDCRQDPVNINVRLENERSRRWSDSY